LLNKMYSQLHSFPFLFCNCFFCASYYIHFGWKWFSPWPVVSLCKVTLTQNFGVEFF
jgi:hypothetical protein